MGAGRAAAERTVPLATIKMPKIAEHHRAVKTSHLTAAIVVQVILPAPSAAYGVRFTSESGTFYRS